LTDELRRLESTVKNTKAPSGERQEALMRLAQILQLTGDFEGAAKAYGDAAKEESKQAQDRARLEGALCWAALGEMDRALAQIKPLLQNPQPGIRLKARYVHAQLQAFHAGDLSPLRSLLDDPDYAAHAPGVYYTLWKVSAEEAYKTRLLAAYPQSPEGRILSKAKSSEMVQPLPLALWVFFPGREGIRMDLPEEASDQVLQTGLFGKEANAMAMADRLKAEGFDAAIAQRVVKGASYWVVTVRSGADMQKTMARLQEKGFESFPVSPF
jgi:hypothetical protein